MTEHHDDTPARRMAESLRRDFIDMADGIEFSLSKGRIDPIVANLGSFVPSLMQKAQALNEWQHRQEYIGVSEEEAVDADIEKVEAAMEATVKSMEDLISHIEDHVPEEEWYSLTYDLSAAIHYLTSQYNGLVVWLAEKVKHEPVNLDDSPILGKSVWRADDDE